MGGPSHTESAVASVSLPFRTESASVPIFTMDAPKYDQSTFIGRLMGMYEVIDPRTLLLSSDDLKKSQELLAKFKATGKKPDGVSDAEMWEARRNVEVSFHPV